MTERDPDAPPPPDPWAAATPDAAAADVADPEAWRAAALAAASPRPVFALEGRAAPGLYVAGWLLAPAGLTLLFVALASSGGGLATYLLAVAGLTALSLGLFAAAGAQGLQRRADGTPGYAGPSPFLVLAAALSTSLLISAALSATGVFDANDPLGLLVSVLITGSVDIGLIALLVVGTGALTWAEMGVRRPTLRALVGDIASGIFLGIVALLATGVVAAILVAILGVEPVGPVPTPETTVDRILNLLAAVIVAPVAEEIFFRGFATTAWLRRMAPGRAILRGALLFALVHVLTLGGADASEAIRIALIAFVARIPVAWLLGWLFVRRDSLWAAIALHATFNGTALLLADLAGRTVTGG
ncbi:MAG: CPBP family intramembrane metalloprotease [Chloroflexi bacterium]|nr:CPBP family intramembrane metalloprotease [Chloroflexota bacterium]